MPGDEDHTPVAPRGRSAGFVRFVFYAAIGAVGTLLHYAILFTLVRAELAGPTLATTVGAVAGAFVNFYLNARLNFRTGASAASALRFYLVALGGIAINAVVVYVLSNLLSVHLLLAQLAATVVVLFVTFAVNSIWTFRR